MPSNDELACTYAALILMDDDVPITGEKINSLLKAANVEIDSYWSGLFAKATSSLDLKGMVTSIGAGVGSGGGGGAAAPAAAAADAAPAEKKKEEVVEESESDDDMGMSLFG